MTNENQNEKYAIEISTDDPKTLEHLVELWTAPSDPKVAYLHQQLAQASDAYNDLEQVIIDAANAESPEAGIAVLTEFAATKPAMNSSIKYSKRARSSKK